MDGMPRREFLRRSAGWVAAGTVLGPRAAGTAHPPFRISLAQWSLHRTIRRGELDNLEFAPLARERYGLGAVEYVNQFFADRALDRAYLGEMRRRADDAGVRSLLIMCDGEGRLGDPDHDARHAAVENHRKWVDAAAFLGCHSIRVNAESAGTREAQADLAADGLRALCEIGDEAGIHVLVENHGGLSSDGAWLADVMRRVDHPRVGTLPDFGNFRISSDPERWYDRYQGVRELMPFAHAVSAKSHEFGPGGEELRTDYHRMMRIVLDAGYLGYVGIEYEGDQLGEHEGIMATRDLLLRVREELGPEGATSTSPMETSP